MKFLSLKEEVFYFSTDLKGEYVLVICVWEFHYINHEMASEKTCMMKEFLQRTIVKGFV